MTGTGLLAIALLLKIPALPNCPAIFWPTASASLRMYCAEIAANKRTVDDLLEAIQLLESLPPDHPLREEIDRLIETWSMMILELGDEAFHAGKLEEAIAMAEKIPPHLAAHELVADQVKQWRLIWAEGEEIYREVETLLRQQKFQEAFQRSNQLLAVDNTYWQTTQHETLQGAIAQARRDGSTLARATRLAEGSLEEIIEGIRLAQGIPESSYLFDVAQKALENFQQGILDLAQDALDREDYDGAIAIIEGIPEDLDLGEEAQDFLNLASAQSHAWRGSATDLETAIAQARRLERDRPLYDRAQRLIRGWQAELQTLRRLDAAQQIAQGGTVTALRAAIAEAQLIPGDNPRIGDVQSQIATWTARIETIEDQPILDQAIQLAQSGTVQALQAAIATAQQISPNRALGGEAQERIASWTNRIQMIQDQPILDRARQLANQGNWEEAIATAQQITAGRSLYADAQAEVSAWQSRIQGQSQLQQAYEMAGNGSVAGLSAAIQLANQVPSDSRSRPEADQMIYTWSYQLLNAAEAQALVDPAAAIAIAEGIPPRTEAYAIAQLRIQTWRQQLQAPPTVPAAPPVN